MFSNDFTNVPHGVDLFDFNCCGRQTFYSNYDNDDEPTELLVRNIDSHLSTIKAIDMLYVIDNDHWPSDHR